MPESLEGRVALFTGSGSGVGANIARGLAEAGMDVWVTDRTAARIEAVAAEIGGHALTGDVSLEDDVAHWFEQTSLGRPARQQRGSARPDGDLRPRGTGVVVAGIRDQRPRRVPVLPRRRSKDARTRGGRIVNVTSGAAYLPAGGFPSTAYAPSKAAVHRFSELLAAQLAPRGVFVFAISPGLVRTALTEPHWDDDAPWTPPACAPRLVQALATGEFDALAGRYLHAEHDPPEVLRGRIEAITAGDLNAIRLRR